MPNYATARGRVRLYTKYKHVRYNRFGYVEENILLCYTSRSARRCPVVREILNLYALICKNIFRQQLINRTDLPIQRPASLAS